MIEGKNEKGMLVSSGGSSKGEELNTFKTVVKLKLRKDQLMRAAFACQTRHLFVSVLLSFVVSFSQSLLFSLMPKNRQELNYQ